MMLRLDMPFRALAAAVRNVWGLIRGYSILAAYRDADERRAICETCPFRRDAQCGKCGCLIDAKVMLNLERCPVGRWEPIWRKN